MASTSSDAVTRQASDGYALTPQQVRFFETFGYLRVEQLFAEDIGRLTDAFEAVFDDPSIDKYEMRQDVHFGQRRIVVASIVDKHPDLVGLKADERILGIIRSLMGEDVEYAESDGNLLWCDTSWHCDIYDAPMRQYHVKLFFYLDDLDADTGALRFIPGTNHHLSDFASSLRQQLGESIDIIERFGVSPEEIPSVAVQNRPGDLMIGNFRTIHATFNGMDRRRLFTMNYRQTDAP